MSLKLTDSGSELILKAYFGSQAEPASFKIALITNAWNTVTDAFGLLSNFTQPTGGGYAVKNIPLTDCKIDPKYTIPTIAMNTGGTLNTGYLWTFNGATNAAITGFVIYTNIIVAPASTATDVVIFAAPLAKYTLDAQLNQIETQFTFKPQNSGDTLLVQPVVAIANVSSTSQIV